MMLSRWEDRELRRYVVRIDRADDGRVLGTGFFVAPGWVVTCAHVVFDASQGTEVDQVLLVPDSSLRSSPVPAVVKARSEPPQGTALWPFPDLALVRLDSELDHPCVRVYPGDPIGGECHAWGFPRREHGVIPPGSPASFHFEGVEGDGYFKLKAGQAAPGLSGAPLLCPGRRAVVGVVSATRDADSDLGGWASPLQALLTGGPGAVPESLTAHREALVRDNEAAVLADRAGWNRVLPIDGTEHLLDQPWSAFTRRPRSKPSELLLADVGVVPYLFRDTDMDRAQAWCEQPAPVEVAQVAARGGAGKTRFAIELCRRMAEQGWMTGLWNRDHSIDDIATTPLPRLVVIDYTEAVAIDVLRNTLNKLTHHADTFAPVRLLLLTRTSKAGTTDTLEEIAKNATAQLRGILADAKDSHAARTLTLEQRHTLYDTAISAFARAWHPDHVTSSRPKTPDLTPDRYQLPLEVLFEAFDHALSAHQPDLARPTVDRALDHEQRYWDATAPADLPAPLRRTAVALATLAGADDHDQADQLLATLPDLADTATAPLRRRTVNWLATIYTGPGLLNPLRPDRLGEALLADVLARHADHGLALLNAVLDLPNDDQVASCLDLLARLTTAQEHTSTPVIQILATRHIELTLRAEDQARGTPDRPGRLTIVGGLLRLFTDAVADRLGEAEPGNTGYALYLAVAYTRLGDLARASGQAGEAERLYRQSLTIRERLAEAEPGNAKFARDLSVSYDRLGDLAEASGQADEAKDLHRQSLTIAERLAEAEPGNAKFARDLSVSYIKMGDLAVSSGQAGEAEDLYRQSLTIAERLAEAEPGNAEFARGLSISYDRLGDLAVSSGQAGEAEDLYRQSLTIAERLAEAEPGNAEFARDLSISYDRLGNLAVSSGQAGEAEDLYRQSLTIRERLAKAEPGNTVYARDLSVSYNKLGDLAVSSGQAGEAEDLYRQSLTIRERLAKAEPDNTVYARGLSVSYNKLGDLAVSSGQAGEAEDLYRQSLTIAERLAKAEPDNTVYARDLSVSYNKLGDLAVSSGQAGEAEDLYRQSLTIAERLAKAEPDNTVYARDLSVSYECLGSICLSDERASQAAQWFQRAASMRRRLYEQEPFRTDLAEELGVAIVLLSQTGQDEGDAAREVITLLDPFERAGALTSKGVALLAWARETPL
ncbi:tetratricopeptide repeat protein [Streptomyces sp. NPDC002209]|uniref:tetratricopeptide repeat protein n=1 Tax=Streptomyces sp. NPDC002209 TaxID=3364638 RepID=UPI003676C911